MIHLLTQAVVGVPYKLYFEVALLRMRLVVLCDDPLLHVGLRQPSSAVMGK